VTTLCLVETDGGAVTDASARALTFARSLGTVVGAVAFTDGGSVSLSESLAEYGVNLLYVVSSIDDYAPQAWARALSELTGFVPTTAVVAAGTDRGNEVLAHLGAITGLPMAANCVSAALSGGLFTITRQRWAGLLLEDAELDAPVALLTVATDAVAPVPAPVSPGLQIVAMDGKTGVVSAYAFKVSQVSAADLVVRAEESATGGGGQSLASARVVVGGGRGVGGAEGFAPLEELADLLGGVVGVSRVVTSEGWRPHTMQVGQTGTKITPDLYLACGISGAIQHFAGCSGAKHIIAINTDPSAPMMTRADYAVVGDLHEVVPALIQALRTRGT